MDKIIIFNQKESDSIINAQRESIEILNSRIEQSSETIQNLNSQVSSFGTMFTATSFLIAFFAIVLPAITWFFGIKPSRDIVKKVKETMDKKIENYLKKQRSQEISVALDNIENGGRGQTEGLNLFNRFDIPKYLTNKHIIRMIELLNDNNFNSSNKYQLCYSLMYVKSKKIQSFYQKVLDEPSRYNSDLQRFALKYFSHFSDIDDLPAIFLGYMKQAPNIYSAFERVYETAKGLQTKEILLEVLNSQKIVSTLKVSFGSNQAEYEAWKNGVMLNLLTQYVTQEEISNTLFATTEFS